MRPRARGNYYAGACERGYLNFLEPPKGELPRIHLPPLRGSSGSRSHSETWAGCRVSPTELVKTLLNASRSVSSRTITEKASRFYAASYFLNLLPAGDNDMLYRMQEKAHKYTFTGYVSHAGAVRLVATRPSVGTHGGRIGTI